MKSSLYLWLAEAEETLWRMIRGVYFTFRRLPQCVARTLRETVGPAAVQLTRVLAVLFLWLALVLIPAICLAKLGGAFWGSFGAVAWLALALGGSAWGQAFLARKCRPVVMEQAAGLPHRDGWSLVNGSWRLLR